MQVKAAMSMGYHIGYILNGVFIQKELYRHIVGDSSVCGDFCFGDLNSNGYFVSSIDKEIFEPVFPNGYKKFNGCKLKQFLFVPDKSYTYNIVSGKTLEVLGNLTLTSDLYRSQSIDIGMLIINEKKKGTGSAVVTFLRSEGFDLEGFPIANARVFWEKCGAEFLPSGRFILRRTDC